LVDRDTSHNSKPLLISAPKQRALVFDRGRNRGECPFGAQAGMSAFRDMPDVAGWNTDFLVCAPNGLLACCAAMDGSQRNSDLRDSFAHPA
jgi:hypothetical protein